MQAQFQLGMETKEVVDQGGNKAFAECGGTAEAEHPVWARLLALQGRLCLTKTIKQFSAMNIVALASIGEMNLACGTVQQWQSQLLFKLGYLAADMRVGNIQLASRRRKGAKPYHFNKSLDAIPLSHNASQIVAARK